MVLQNLIGGEWVTPRAAATVPVHNPSTGEVIGETPLSSGEDVEQAVQAAQHAFGDWSGTPAPQRSQVMFRYRELLEREFEALARGVTRENGKTLDEARGDVRRGIEVVEFACGIAHLTKGESLPQVAEQIDAFTMREPLGVCAGITPFNFPAMVPMWMYPLAIACGNTFLLKPSEKVPLTAMRLAELLLEAGLPPGVFNLVHGGAEVVDALCTHPGIAAISFVGSSRIAAHVYALGCAHGKRVQAAGGAKNVLLVMPDAEPDPTLRAILASAYGCAGQRCMAGSVLMAVGQPTADEWCDRVSQAISGFQVADTSAHAAVDMGPVIDAAARQRVQQYLGRVDAEGARVACDLSDRSPDRGFFVGPALVDHVKPEMTLFTEEIFGPVLSLVRPDTLAEAIRIMNGLSFGNGASIFTSSGSAARQFVRRYGGRDARGQCRGAGPDGAVQFLRLEPQLFRRPARSGHRRGDVLHAAEVCPLALGCRLRSCSGLVVRMEDSTGSTQPARPHDSARLRVLRVAQVFRPEKRRCLRSVVSRQMPTVRVFAVTGPSISPGVLHKHPVDQFEQPWVVVAQLCPRIDVVMHVVVFPIRIEIRLHPLGPVFAAIGEGVGVLPQFFVSGLFED